MSYAESMKRLEEIVTALEADLPNMRFLCSFTSIAGRQGNAMQFGYCAANQILDVEMARIAAHEDAPRAVAIAWAPWSDIGMATRGSLEKIRLLPDCVYS